MAVLYAEAIARVPLGMTTAIQFTGPLAVAIASSRGLHDIVWAALAGLGVSMLMLTATGWSADALRHLLCLRRGRVLGGIHRADQAGWAKLPRAARADGVADGGGLKPRRPFGMTQIRVGVHTWEIAAAFGLGILIPVVPYGLEMLALRRMSARAFGILMSADPAIASLAGFLILHQTMGLQKVIGIACVVFASLGATLGRRS